MRAAALRLLARFLGADKLWRMLAALDGRADRASGEVTVTVVLEGQYGRWVSRSSGGPTAGVREDGQLVVCVRAEDVVAGFLRDVRRRIAAEEKEQHEEANHE